MEKTSLVAGVMLVAGVLVLAQTISHDIFGLTPSVFETVHTQQPPSPKEVDDNVNLPAVHVPKVLTCGVLWFVHLSKTGGGTVQKKLHDMAGRCVLNGKLAEYPYRGSPWLFVDLYNWKDCDPVLGKQDIRQWHKSPTWSFAADELEKATPHLIVHQHHCSPGAILQLMPHLIDMKRSLEAKGCRLAITTVVRDPVEIIVSGIFFRHRVPALESSSWTAYVDSRKSMQMRYLLEGETHMSKATEEHGRIMVYNLNKTKERPNWSDFQMMQLAKHGLEHFEFFGETTLLSDYLAAIAMILSRPPLQKIPHKHRVKTHPYELTESHLEYIRRDNGDKLLWDYVHRSNRLVRVPLRKQH